MQILSGKALRGAFSRANLKLPLLKVLNLDIAELFFPACAGLGNRKFTSVTQLQPLHAHHSLVTSSWCVDILHTLCAPAVCGLTLALGLLRMYTYALLNVQDGRLPHRPFPYSSVEDIL